MSVLKPALTGVEVKSLVRRPWFIFGIALVLMVAACGGEDESGSPAPSTERPSDWGSGMTYDDCDEQGLTDYGLRTGQKWIDEFYADLYQCAAPDTTGSTPQATTTNPSLPASEPGTTSAHTSASPTTNLPPLLGLRYEPVFTDVRGILDDENAMPLQIVGRPEGQYNYMITRDGRVWIVEEDTFYKAPVLDLRESVGIGSESGLLGIAIHPVDPRRVFLHYTDRDLDIIIAEYRLDEKLRIADPTSAKTLLKIPTRSDLHKGGMLSFGPDGYLYVGVGDDGYNYNGQDPASLLGSILRIDVDGGDPYAIPTDHPSLTAEAPEVYLYGIRNPWRFWIDPDTNLVFIGDVGADAFEEINVTSLDSPGANFGWSVLEGHQWGPFSDGITCQENPDTCDISGFIPPVLTIAQEGPICAVVGGVVYNGSAIPELKGHYFYGDVCAGFLRSFKWNGTLATDLRDWTPEVGPLTQLLSFGVDTEGEMYVLTFDHVFRIVPVR